MNLLLDIGNTRLKWARADGEILIATGAFRHRDNPDWPAELPQERPDAVWVATVAHAEIPKPLQRFAARHWGLEPRHVVTTAAACGVRTAYPRPERLGIDRWLASIAAHHRGPGSALVADAGTALTLDFVTAEGRHRGGVIVPGLSTMRDALIGGTRLRFEPGEYERDWLAVDTDPAVALGTLQAVLGVIENARRDLRPDRVLLTGGEAPALAPHLDDDWQHIPDLVLEGLARLAATGDNNPA